MHGRKNIKLQHKVILTIYIDTNTLKAKRQGELKLRRL